MAHQLSAFSCGLEAALAVLGGKWKPLVLYHLSKGSLRYGELQRAVGAVTHKVLIQQLKELEADRVVKRVDHGEIPPRVEYSLTPLGRSLASLVVEIENWVTANYSKMTGSVRRYDSPAASSAR